jgi:hypothetical protein
VSKVESELIYKLVEYELTVRFKEKVDDDISRVVLSLLNIGLDYLSKKK